MSNPLRDSIVRPELAVAIGEHGSLRWLGPVATDERSDTVRRIRQPELRGGIRARAGLRAEWIRAGSNPADLVVALEVDVLIATDAGAARAELRRLGEVPFGETVRYIGTAHGLTTLIRDIYAADVADAVILCPIDPSGGTRTTTSTLIMDQVLPTLRERSVAA